MTKSTKLRSLAPGIRSRKANISDISHAKAQSLQESRKENLDLVFGSSLRSLRLSLRLCVKLDSSLKSRYEETITALMVRPGSDRLEKIVPDHHFLNHLLVLFEFH